MDEYKIFNLLDLSDSIGEESLQNILCDFSCPLNPEIENYAKRSALDLNKKKISMTYAVIDSNSNIASLFTLTHKAIEVDCNCFSKNMKKKLKRFANPSDFDDSLSLSAFLIAQLGKNYAVGIKAPSGLELMDFAIDILKKAQHLIGGGVVYVECENKEKLLEFYQNDENRFYKFGKRFSLKDNIEYTRLLKLI